MSHHYHDGGSFSTNESRKPRLLDLCCGAGGAAMGYWIVGFDVVGVDINPQPNYPFDFIQADVFDFMSDGPHPGVWNWDGFDAIHASFPCQFATRAQKIQGNEHPDLVTPGRELIRKTGLPYVMENVPGAPLIDPVLLEGTMFGLRTYRPRLFETNFHIPVPPVPPRTHKQAKMGRPPKDGEFIQVVGHFSNVPAGRRAMGIDWMTRGELAEAIPPAYTAFVGAWLHDDLDCRKRAFAA